MFYAGGYSEQYHVLAENKELALQYLEKYLLEEDIKKCKNYLHYADTKEFVFPNTWRYPNGRIIHTIDFQEWVELEGYYVKQFKSLSKPESISEFDIGVVNQTEVS